MTAGRAGDSGNAADWDVYWRGTHENAAHRQGGPQEQVLADFWGELFRSRRHEPGFDSLLDLACGNGAVTGYALQVAPGTRSFCTDYSLSALLELRKRHPRSHCVASDALHTPFAGGSFDIVASQFGIEYAGRGALREAARLVAPGGVLAVVLHLHGGGIYRECARNLEAVEAIRESRVLPLAQEAFAAGFALNAGTGSVAAFKAAEGSFTPAVRALEEILRRFGDGVADGLAKQLYSDIAHMYRRMSAYEPAELMAWIEGMVAELAAYGGRMSSMLAAAVDAASLDAEIAGLEAEGLQPLRKRTLEMGAAAEAAAWALVFSRGAGDG